MCHRQFKTPFCIFCMFFFCPFRFRLFEFYDIRFKIFHNISGIVCDRNCFRYFVIYNYISSTSSFSLIFPNGSYWSQGIVPHLNENLTSSKVGFFFIFTRFLQLLTLFLQQYYVNSKTRYRSRKRIFCNILCQKVTYVYISCRIMLPLEPTGCGGVTGDLTRDSGVFFRGKSPKIPLSAGIENGKNDRCRFFRFFLPVSRRGDWQSGKNVLNCRW